MKSAQQDKAQIELFTKLVYKLIEKQPKAGENVTIKNNSKGEKKNFKYYNRTHNI